MADNLPAHLAEKMRMTLKRYVQMLGDMKFGSDNIQELQEHIKSMLENNKRVVKEIAGLTALMLYATFNITDERMTELLQQRDDAYITKALPSPKNIVNPNALVFAAENGSIKAIEILINTGYFTEQAYKDAFFMAVILNKPESLRVLKQNKVCNIFEIKLGFYQKTLLQIACDLGHDKIVEEILHAKPSDSYIGYFDSFSNYTAYQTALEKGHTECATQLSLYPSSKYLQISNAILQNENEAIATIKSILEEAGPSLIAGDYNHRTKPVITLAVEANYMELLKILFKQLTKLADEQQISILLISASYLNEMIDTYGKTNGSLTEGYQQVINKLNILIASKKDYSDVKRIKLNCIFINKEIQKAIVKILTAAHQLQEIDFVMQNNLLLGREVKSIPAVNIYSNFLPRFIACLLSNSQLLKCNVRTTRKMTPIKELLNTILERNDKISKAQRMFSKDKIYNLYVPIINDKIKLLKTAKLLPADFTTLEARPRKVYSLAELTSFYLLHNDNARDKKGKPLIIDGRKRLVLEANQIVESVRLPPELLPSIDKTPAAPADPNNKGKQPDQETSTTKLTS